MLAQKLKETLVKKYTSDILVASGGQVALWGALALIWWPCDQMVQDNKTPWQTCGMTSLYQK